MRVGVLDRIQNDAMEPHVRLVEENVRLAYFAARKLTALRPAEYNDALSDAFLGLVRGALAFDFDRGVLPSTFLLPRIRGAILDGIRSRDRLSRIARKREGQIRQAWARASQRHLRAPTDREVAQELGVPVETLWRWQDGLAGDEWVSLDMFVESGADGRRVALLDIIEDTKVAGEVGRVEALVSLERSFRVLSPNERRVIGLYYLDGFKLSEIAEHLGVTESRVSQINSAAKSKLLRAMTQNRSVAA